MQQHSEEWFAHRARHFNASEAGAVMGCNPWLPRNPAELYDLKKGLRTVQESPAMRRGTELEEQARELAGKLAGVVFTPVVLTKGRYSASLDGLDFSDTLALEVKCPSEKSELWGVKTAADVKKAAPYYWWQLVHQHYVAAPLAILFFVYSPDREPVYLSISGELLAADHAELLVAWEAYAAAHDSNTRPDDGERRDEEWEGAAIAYLFAKRAADEAAAAADAAKQRLLDLANGAPAKGCGVSVIATTRKGGLDEKAAAAAGIDLTAYRKKDTTYFQVRAEKCAE